MEWLKKYKDYISSIGSIATAVGVVAALFFSVNGLIIEPKKPIIDLLKTKIAEQEERLIIYNGGSGACVALSIEFPNIFLGITQIVNYENSWLTNTELKNGMLQSSARAFYVFKQENICKNNSCIIDAGFLKSNGTFSLVFKKDFNKTGEAKVVVSCINSKKSITLFSD